MMTCHDGRITPCNLCAMQPRPNTWGHQPCIACCSAPSSFPGSHPMQPPSIELSLAVLALVRHRRRPAATVCVLGVLPLGLDVVLEQVERGGGLQLAGRPDVVVEAAHACKRGRCSALLLPSRTAPMIPQSPNYCLYLNLTTRSPRRSRMCTQILRTGHTCSSTAWHVDYQTRESNGSPADA